MKRFLLWLGVSIAIIAIFSTAIYLFVSELLDTEPVISHDSYVQMQLGGTIPEYNVPDALGEYLGSNGLNMQKVRNTFRMAAVDDRIEGIVVHHRNPNVETGDATFDHSQTGTKHTSGLSG